MSFWQRNVRLQVTGTLCALFATTVLTSLAQAVAVNNYNWMQIPTGLPTGVVTGVGGTTAGAFNTSGFSGHNSPSHFRWSDLWIPNSTVGNNGATPNNSPGKGDYWATAALDEPRHIERVDFALWNNEGTGVQRVRIEASSDGGASYNPIGLHDFGSMQQNNSPSVINTVAITPGTYSHVRLRFNGEDTNGIGNADYLYGNAGRGGPGVRLFEVLGDGNIASDKANWANQPNFGTTASNSAGLTFNGLNYNDGLLCNSCGAGRAGEDNPWEAGKYTQINLGQARFIGKSIFDWNDGWGANTMSIQYSTDGTTYLPVTSAVQTIQVATSTSHRVTFDPVIAQYFRVTGATGGSPYYIFDEWMLYSPMEGVLDSNPGANGTIVAKGSQSMVTLVNNAITLENIGDPGSAIAIFDYTITGPDAGSFDLSSFAETILEDGESLDLDLEIQALLAEANAVITFNTSIGDISFNLAATVVPEPSTLAMLGLGVASCLVAKRRRRK